MGDGNWSERSLHHFKLSLKNHKVFCVSGKLLFQLWGCTILIHLDSSTSIDVTVVADGASKLIPFISHVLKLNFVVTHKNV